MQTTDAVLDGRRQINRQKWLFVSLGVGVAVLSALSFASASAQDCGIEVDVGTAGKRCLRPGAGVQFKDCHNCPAMVIVPAGSFTMGSPASEPEREPKREHQVRITFVKPFAIGSFAITRGEFAAFVSATGHKPGEGCYFWTGIAWEEHPDRSWQSPGFPQDEHHPVVCVDVNDAKAYAAWLTVKTGNSYRLATEAEREYVSRAGTTTPFWWGSSISTDQANYNGEHVYAKGSKGERRQHTVTVDSFSPNPWGLFNVHGNVWDWTDECWSESNEGAPSDGSARSGGDCRWRAVRGGAWNYSPDYLRAAYRYWNEPHNRSSVQGFRLMRSLRPG